MIEYILSPFVIFLYFIILYLEFSKISINKFILKVILFSFFLSWHRTYLQELTTSIYNEHYLHYFCKTIYGKWKISKAGGEAVIWRKKGTSKSRAWRARRLCVLTCSSDWHAHMHTCLVCLHTYLLACLTCLRARWLIFSRPQYPWLFYVFICSHFCMFTVIKYLTCSHACVLGILFCLIYFTFEKLNFKKPYIED